MGGKARNNPIGYKTRIVGRQNKSKGMMPQSKKRSLLHLTSGKGNQSTAPGSPSSLFISMHYSHRVSNRCKSLPLPLRTEIESGIPIVQKSFLSLSPTFFLYTHTLQYPTLLSKYLHHVPFIPLPLLF